jgi:hypothetical protein
MSSSADLLTTLLAKEGMVIVSVSLKGFAMDRACLQYGKIEHLRILYPPEEYYMHIHTTSPIGFVGQQQATARQQRDAQCAYAQQLAKSLATGK